MFILFFLFAQKLRYNNVLAISFISNLEIKLQNISNWSYALLQRVCKNTL